MSEEIIKLHFVIPGKDAPGFLLRQRQALEFSRKIQENSTSPEVLDELVDYLMQFITEPEDEKSKKDALWMASENEFMKLLSALMGGNETENPL